MSKFSWFSFGNPTNKTVTGTAYTRGLIIVNHLNQSLWSTNQKYWAAVRSNLLHSFLEVHNCVGPFTSHCELHEFGTEKPISWAKPAHFDVFAINFTVESHTEDRWRCSKLESHTAHRWRPSWIGISFSGRSRHQGTLRALNIILNNTKGANKYSG
jgi:hypothetical protein